MTHKNKFAFPTASAGEPDQYLQEGMTLYEYYAGLAMQAVITSKPGYSPEYKAKLAVGYADALIAAMDEEQD